MPRFHDRKAMWQSRRIQRNIGLVLVLVIVLLLGSAFGIWVWGQRDGKEIIVPPVYAEGSDQGKGYITPISEGSLDMNAKSAILIDGGTGTVLYSQDSQKQLPLASVTKVMTMLLALEAVESGQFSLQDEVRISERAASMGGSQMYMEQGETQSVENLLKGMGICSANDACVAMAEFTRGTEELFVEAMNQRAKELGMEHTNFVNTNGLPVANHYSCAYDIALMSKELLKHPETKEWFQTWQTTVKVGLPGKQTELGLTNTNRMIKLYAGANGIKTGFTQEAGYCLSSSATRGDLTLISVIMGAPTSKIRFSEASRLLDYGFANYDSVALAKKGQIIGNMQVEKGSPQTVNAVADSDISVLIKKGEKRSISTETVLKEGLKAPIKTGEVVGEMMILRENKEIGRYPLYSDGEVCKAGVMELYLRMLQTLL